jgi:RNA polymerase sigma factor (sigma-70 family)
MATRLVEEARPLDAEQLRAIEVALCGKLRAHRLSETFIARYSDDLIQQALTEYTRVCDQGQSIENPGGWAVNTAFRRAIDQLRREGRETSPIAAEVALETTEGTGAPPDEEAIRNIEAEQLHEAISRLSVAQRQALSLYYFSEKSTREGADALGWSEPTFRRRRDSALRALRERFGVIEIPEPAQGDQLAIEIGLAAWISLAGAQGYLAAIGNQLAGAADAVRGGAGTLADRVRDYTTRILSSGSSEGIVNVASGPAGKAAGICGAAVAAAVCVTGVIGPGVGGIDLIHQSSKPATSSAHRRAARPAPIAQPHHPSPPAEAPREVSRHPHRSPSSTSSSGGSGHAQKATEEATEQFAPESEVPTSSETAPATSSPPPAASSASSPTQTASEQFGPRHP